jgi:hypothetical protein
MLTGEQSFELFTWVEKGSDCMPEGQHANS